MVSLISTYDQAQLLSTSPGSNPHVLTVVQATTNGTNWRKKYLALVCGVVQICTGLMAFSLGVIESSTPMLTLGFSAHIGLITTVLAGAFGIQYGRTGGKCPTIASMVFSILSTMNYTAGFIIYCMLLAIGITHYDTVIMANATACAVMMVVISIINAIASIVQSACACGLVCPCGPTNSNAYIMASQEFQQQA